MESTMRIQHTPGLWDVWAPGEDDMEGQYEIVSEYFADGSRRFVPVMIAECCAETQEADAHRIVAAVNACAGIPTEALEGGVVGELLEACRALAKWMDERGPMMGGRTAEVHRLVTAAIARAEGRATPAPQGATQEGEG